MVQTAVADVVSPANALAEETKKLIAIEWTLPELKEAAQKIHSVAEELGDETGIAGLGAAGAGTGELEVGLLELAALDGVVLHVGLGSGLHQVIPNLGLLGFALLRHHLDGLILGKAHLYADAAAHAVQGADADSVGVYALALAGLDGSGLDALGGVFDLILGQSVSANGR